jgi:hypothetical protein
MPKNTRLRCVTAGSASIYKFASKLTWLAFICLVALLLDTSAGRVSAFPARVRRIWAMRIRCPRINMNPIRRR